jgi:SAM-dependent methyltransferase
MTAEEYYRRHALVQMPKAAPAAPGRLGQLSARPSEAEYALHWLFREGKQGAILDVGCGPLALLKGAAGMFARREGVDIARCANWETEPGIVTGLCDLDQGPLPFAGESFDAVTCLMVLEHVFDPFHAVRELRRVCKPDGRVIVGVPNLAGLKRRLELLFGRLPVTSTQASFTDDAWDGYHLHNFTQASLAWLLHREGLRPIRWGAQGRFRALKRWRPSFFGNDLVVMACRAEPGPKRPFPS